MTAPFQLDMSGVVTLPNGDVYSWDGSVPGTKALTPFCQGYVEAMFAELIASYREPGGLKVGDKVRVHTDERGTVTGFIPGRTKNVQVLFSPGWGGQYFPFECAVVAPGFSDLAPVTIKRIIADCEARCAAVYSSGSAATGQQFWNRRQSRDVRYSAFPPLTVTFGDDGLIYLGEAQQ